MPNHASTSVIVRSNQRKGPWSRTAHFHRVVFALDEFAQAKVAQLDVCVLPIMPKMRKYVRRVGKQNVLRFDVTMDLHITDRAHQNNML